MRGVFCALVPLAKVAVTPSLTIGVMMFPLAASSPEPRGNPHGLAAKSKVTVVRANAPSGIANNSIKMLRNEYVNFFMYQLNLLVVASPSIGTIIKVNVELRLPLTVYNSSRLRSKNGSHIKQNCCLSVKITYFNS